MKRRTPTSSFLFSTLLVFLVPPRLCEAQTWGIFQWAFSNNAISDYLPSCTEFPVTVKPWNTSLDTHGVPPFYMRAFAVGGTPITSMIGTSENDLKWTVQHPVDTKLMLVVIDSQGSSGGVAPKLYTVVTGQSTSCIRTPDTSITLTANKTDVLNTCEPWGITIKGGVPPFNISLAALNSPVVTNVTTGPVDDAFTYIDRADPGTQLLVAVNDFTGRYASGTPIIHTQGSTNYECVGLDSSSGNSTKLAQEADARSRAAAAATRRRELTIGLSVSLVCVFVLGALGAAWWWLRRRSHKRDDEFTIDTAPKPFLSAHDTGDSDGYAQHTHTYGNGEVLNITSLSSTNGGGARSPKSPYGPVGSNSNTEFSNTSYHGLPTFDPYLHERTVSAGGRPASSSSGNNTYVNTSTTPSRRTKAAEAGVANVGSVDLSTSASHLGGGGGGVSTPNRSHTTLPSTTPTPGDHNTNSAQWPHMTLSPDGTFVMTPRVPHEGSGAGAGVGVDGEGGGGGEYVYQHRDGGAVRELPPPYADRTREVGGQ